jgi:hypothetical protein
MSRYYRALISVPVAAASDEQAYRIATQHAHSLLHPGRKVIAGHLEFLGEVAEGSLMEIARPVHEDPLFLKQLPPDWKP